MDTQPKVPAVSSAEMQQFWAGCEAIQPAPGEQKQPETNTTLIVLQQPMAVDLLCLACGERGGDWQRGPLAIRAVPGTMAENERVAIAADRSGSYVYAHICRGVGIDLPGVGVLRPGESSPVKLRSGRESGAGEVSPGPASDVDEERERLFSQLIFASRELALAQIEPAAAGEPAFCTECVKDAYGDGGAIAHEDDCRTGRVMRVLTDLVATLRSNPDPKEAAADEETPEAGDGIRPRGIALQAIDHLLNRIAEDPRLAYHFDPISRSMELLTSAWAALREQDVEVFRSSYYSRLRFEAPRYDEGGAR